MDHASRAVRPACWLAVGLLAAATPTIAYARTHHWHRHAPVAHERMLGDDADDTGATYPITAGQTDIRINSVGEVITSRHP